MIRQIAVEFLLALAFSAPGLFSEEALTRPRDPLAGTGVCCSQSGPNHER